ncbi:sterol desaturase family protein [Alphaproteobacteria bacterium KMM 3653]|uniref:Sterol desaturase family protein n=1 Tax=Harenicola maris TaxID=2841044 RepID=A0AAP2CN67_9RHOB|nr:sterol desaturase family protein [Harenicola maris]
MTRLKTLATHPSLLSMAAAALCGIAILTTGPWWAWLLIPLGFGAQMLNEYALHRFIFHLPPPKQQWAFDLLYQAHYGHHDFPTNTALFFVPIWVAIPVLGLNFTLIWAASSLLGLPAPLYIATAVALTGGVLMFLIYEWFHMTAHLTLPKGPIERHVTTLHNQHHFRDFSKWFHVSPGGEVIDRLAGTAISRDTLKSRQRIDFIRTLGMAPNDPRLIKARTRFASRYGLTKAEVSRAAKA